jgi:hypothetical protein
MLETDIERCLALTTDRFLYDVGGVPALASFWTRLINAKTGLPPLVITEADDPANLIYFSTMVAVSDARADRYHGLAQPKIGLSMAQELASGHELFLAREEVALANASTGINLVVTHHGYEVRDDASSTRLRTATYELARRYLTGWNLRSYTNEIYAENAERDGKLMGEALGFRVKQFPPEALDAAGLPVEKQPWVWLATREDAVARPVGLPLAMLFLSFSVPKFGFGEVEQEMLNLALEGLTDESIAAAMGSSLSSVKKRFRTIYEKVQDSFESKPVAAIRGPLGDGSRGIETRRRLLNYLRDHREELHPYLHGPSLETSNGRTSGV